MGDGPAVVLLHGFLSGGAEAWLRPGHARALVARGMRVVIPDLRGHGDSNWGDDPDAPPPDALVDDVLALVEHLGLEEYGLGGYSLGGRLALGAIVRGATPRAAVIGGQGLGSVTGDGVSGGGGEVFRRVVANPGEFAPGTVEAIVEEHLRRTGADRAALLRVLDSLMTTDVAALRRVEVPTLVVCGVDDPRAGAELAAALPRGRFAEIPGDHFAASRDPKLGAAMADHFAAALVRPPLG